MENTPSSNSKHQAGKPHKQRTFRLLMCRLTGSQFEKMTPFSKVHCDIYFVFSELGSIERASWGKAPLSKREK